MKFQLIETDSEHIAAHTDAVHLQGMVEKIGTAEAIVSHAFGARPPQRSTEELLTHHAAVSRVVGLLGRQPPESEKAAADAPAEQNRRSRSLNI